MPKLEVLLADPGVRHVATPAVTWFLTGCSEAGAARLARDGGDGDRLEPELCAQAGDASIIKIVHDGGRAARVAAWRGPTSKHDVFWLKTGAGDLILADHFRNAIARVPPADRAPGDDALADHFLFRAPSGDASYCRRIKRLEPGTRIAIDVASGTLTQSLFHRMDEPPVRRGFDAYLDDVETAFTDTLGPYRSHPDIANFFSGGVDSTLLQAYLGPATPALNLIVDMRDAAATMEAGYAERAADALEIPLVRQQVHRSDFLRDFEAATEKTGMPIFNGSLAVFDRLFTNPHGIYVCGMSADSLFGHAALFHRVASWFANPAALWCLRLLTPLVARKDLARHNVWRERVEQLLPNAQQLAAPTLDSDGYAARAETYAEFALAEAVFGAETIKKRLESRLAQVLDHVVLSAPERSNFARHLEIGSWIELFGDDYSTQMRHLAIAAGKRLLLPYIAGAVVRSALRIPTEERYVRGFEGKPIPKGLLKRHLPAYPTNQRKGHTLLAPFPQYYTRGPLQGLWEDYGVPDCIAASSVKDRLLAAPFRLTYNAVSYAVWSRHVRDNAALAPLPGTRPYDWPSAAG